MKLIWQIEPQDIKRVRTFNQKYENDPLVKQRRRRNLAVNKPPLTKAEIWNTMVFCLLTTQQRSGPNSAVARFIRQQPFPLDYENCLNQGNLKSWVYKILTDFGGIRRTKRVADELQTNLIQLQERLWLQIGQVMDKLRRPHDATQERKAAEFIQKNFKGFGPKQSRNFLQMLGLTLYEIPIDSRITKWLNKFGFPLQLRATSLYDSQYYNLVSDGFQQLCHRSDIYPCILDAAIFASFDEGGWTEENVVW